MHRQTHMQARRYTWYPSTRLIHTFPFLRYAPRSFIPIFGWCGFIDPADAFTLSGNQECFRVIDEQFFMHCQTTRPMQIHLAKWFGGAVRGNREGAIFSRAYTYDWRSIINTTNLGFESIGVNIKHGVVLFCWQFIWCKWAIRDVCF